jgi:hypothetical protein
MYHLRYFRKKLFRMIFKISGKVDYWVSLPLGCGRCVIYPRGSCTIGKASELVLGLSEDGFNVRT